MPHLRLHDLRHQFASFLVNDGRTLYEVQQILGNSDPKVTMRYAHLPTQALREAANSAALKIQGRGKDMEGRRSQHSINLSGKKTNPAWSTYPQMRSILRTVLSWSIFNHNRVVIFKPLSTDKISYPKLLPQKTDNSPN